MDEICQVINEQQSLEVLFLSSRFRDKKKVKALPYEQSLCQFMQTVGRLLNKRQLKALKLQGFIIDSELPA